METAGKELENAELKASMKDTGIGTPATRAAIIETLFSRQYIVREKKNLVPTEKGLAVYNSGRGNDGYVGKYACQNRKRGNDPRHIPQRYRGVRKTNHG